MALVGAMLTVGLGTLRPLVTVAWPLAARLGFIASYGKWSPGLVEHFAPVPTPISMAACLGGMAMATRAAHVITRERSGSSDAQRPAAR